MKLSKMISMAFSINTRNQKEECGVFSYPIRITSTDPPGVHVTYHVSHRFKVFQEGTDLRFTFRQNNRTYLWVLALQSHLLGFM